ncbi:MAG: pitrilysin family protein [Longimicrobiales bacterium]|nr:pitrilysin family protein [Longimicrobiales bacterium]
MSSRAHGPSSAVRPTPGTTRVPAPGASSPLDPLRFADRGRRAAEKGRRFALALALLVAVGVPATAPVPGAAQTPEPESPPLQADPQGISLGERLPVREMELDNGMRVLLLPRRGAPTVAFVMKFAVGGIHEHLGTTGVAHLLEHMLFKGTESIGTTDVQAERELFRRADAIHDRILSLRSAYPGAIPDSARLELDRLRDSLTSVEDSARTFVVSNEFDRILTRAGARGLNATTSNEATTYFVELPANRAELFFILEGDRMRRPVFREFYTERDVVMEERRMRVESNPAGALYEAHLGAAFTMHPYGVPVVGYRSDLETLRRADIARYYRDFYGPNNAVLAVVGDFDPEQVEAWVRRDLEPIPRGLEPPAVHAVEPRQRGERRVEVVWDAEPSVRIGWHVPAVTHSDAPALAVLSAILTGGRTARLHRRLVTEERKASSIFSSMGPGELHPRLFQIEATPIHPTTTEELEAAVYEEIRRIAKEGPTEEEVERVRNQIAASAIRRLRSNFGLALQLADSETLLGDWRATFRATDRLRNVTSRDVQRVAGAYFEARNRTVATLVPRRPEGS